MADSQEKDQAPDPAGEADRGADAEVFSGDKAELAHRLGEDGQYGLAVDLQGDGPGGDECAEEDSAKENR